MASPLTVISTSFLFSLFLLDALPIFHPLLNVTFEVLDAASLITWPPALFAKVPVQLFDVWETRTTPVLRSEERRVGKECRYQCMAYQLLKIEAVLSSVIE